MCWRVQSRWSGKAGKSADCLGAVSPKYSCKPKFIATAAALTMYSQNRPGMGSLTAWETYFALAPATYPIRMMDVNTSPFPSGRRLLIIRKFAMGHAKPKHNNMVDSSAVWNTWRLPFRFSARLRQAFSEESLSGRHRLAYCLEQAGWSQRRGRATRCCTQRSARCLAPGRPRPTARRHVRRHREVAGDVQVRHTLKLARRSELACLLA